MTLLPPGAGRSCVSELGVERAQPGHRGADGIARLRAPHAADAAVSHRQLPAQPGWGCACTAEKIHPPGAEPGSRAAHQRPSTPARCRGLTEPVPACSMGSALAFLGGNQGWGQASPWPYWAPPCSVSAQRAASRPHRPEHSSGPRQPLASRGPQLPAGCPVGCTGINGLPGPPALLPGGGTAAEALRDVPKTSQQILRADRKPRRFCMRPDPGLCEKRFSIECLVVNCSSNWFSRV